MKIDLKKTMEMRAEHQTIHEHLEEQLTICEQSENELKLMIARARSSIIQSRNMLDRLYQIRAIATKTNIEIGQAGEVLSLNIALDELTDKKDEVA